MAANGRRWARWLDWVALLFARPTWTQRWTSQRVKRPLNATCSN